MSGTVDGVPYVTSSDPVAQFPVTSEALANAVAARVKKAGDQMTGNLTVQPAAGEGIIQATSSAAGAASRIISSSAAATALVEMRALAGQIATLYFRGGSDGLKLRWSLGKTASAESGGNAGGDLTLTAHDDAGAGLHGVLTASRATGLITVRGDPTAALGIATKQYVDNVGKWQAYTPTLSGIPGTVSGRYTRIGNTVHFTAIVAVTGAATGEVAVGLPVAALVTSSAPPLTFPVRLVCAGASYLGITLHNSATNVLLRWVNPDLKNGFSPISATVPAAWASGDSIRLGGTYEAA